MQEITKRNPLVSEAQEPTQTHVASSLQTRRAFNRMMLAVFLRVRILLEATIPLRKLVLL